MQAGFQRWRKGRERRALAGALALALAGCAIDPALDRSVPAAPASFRESAGGAAPPSLNWPRLFGSPELTRLVERAQAENLDIAVAVARIEQADAQARLNAVNLYPQLSGTGNGDRNLSPATARSKTGPFNSSVSNSFSLGLAASYELDFWGKYRSAANAGALLAQATRFDIETVRLSTNVAVVNAYFNILAAQDRLRIARDNIEIAGRVLTAVRQRLSVGTATGLDVAQQESVLASQRASVPALEQAVQQNRNVLAVLTGRIPESVSVKGGSLNGLRIPHVRAGLPSQLLLRRPDIAAAEAHLASQSASVDEARAAFYPDIKLTGQTGLQSLVLKNLLRPEAIAAAIAGQLTQPIFNGYQLQSQLDLSKGRFRELLETYRKTIIASLSDVENGLIAVQKTSEHERLQALAVAAAQKAYQITEQRLREGTIDIVTVLNTQQTLFQAQDTLSQIRLQRLQAVVSLFQALGGGWSSEPLAVKPGQLPVRSSGVPSL